MVEFEECCEMIVFKDKNWTAILSEKEIKLNLVCEAIDMDGATGETMDGYPIMLACAIMVDSKDMSKKYKKEVSQSMESSTIFDAYEYSGGVTVNHTLNSITEVKPVSHTNAKCKIIDDKKWGKEVWCETTDDALQYAKDIYSSKAEALFGLVGFVLDQPINRIGNTGWDILEQQALAIDYIQKRLNQLQKMMQK